MTEPTNARALLREALPFLSVLPESPLRARIIKELELSEREKMLDREHLEARGLVLAEMVEQEATIAALRARVAKLEEALKKARPFVNIATSAGQAKASTRWYGKAVAALAAIDAALKDTELGE